MRAFRDAADAIASAPTDLGTTAWVRISQDDVGMFADATRAHEWIHVDVDRARRDGPFGTTVAHGYLTLSLATAFITELMQIGGLDVGVNYGLDRVRFPAPVRVGSRVRAHGELLSAQQHADRGVRTVVRLTYESDVGGPPPCVADVVSLGLATA